MNSRSRTFDAGSAHCGYENFLPEASFPVIRTSVNGEAAGVLFFFLFFSAFGFFSRDCFSIGPLPHCLRFASGEHLAFTRKALEVGKHRGNQLLLARILRRERCRKEIEEIAGFFGSLMPIRRRGRKQVGFQFVLPEAQCLLVRLHVRQEPPKLGRLLCGHPAMLIEVDGIVGHDRAP